MINHEYVDHYLCSVDPLTLGIGIASLFGGVAASGALSGGGGGAQAAAPTAAPTSTAAPVSTSPTTSKPTTANNTPSFVGAQATPTPGMGQKTLLGQ